MLLAVLTQRRDPVLSEVPVFFFVFGRLHARKTVTRQRLRSLRKRALRRQCPQREQIREIGLVFRCQLRQTVQFVSRRPEIPDRQVQPPQRLLSREFPEPVFELPGVFQQIVRPGPGVGQALQESMKVQDKIAHRAVAFRRGVAV